MKSKYLSLSLAVVLLTSQHIAISKTISQEDDYIHFTHIRLTHHTTIAAPYIVYQGTKVGNECQKLRMAKLETGRVANGSSISSYAHYFKQPLNKNSCAIEEWIDDKYKLVIISYDLINDGKKVTDSNPSNQDVFLD